MNQIPNIEETNSREVEDVIKEFDEMPFGVTIPFNQDMMWGEKEGFEADGREEFKQWLRTTLHQQLQKAREEERERCIQAIKNPLTDWECIADLEDGDAHNHKTITVCRAVASINNIFKE